MPKVVSTVLLSEAYCCRYLVAISPNSKVLTSGGSRGGPQGPGPPLQKYFLKIKKLNLIKIELGRFEDSILQQFLTEERRFNILLVVNSLGPPLTKIFQKNKKVKFDKN